MFQKFNFDTEWAVRIISKITNDEDIPIEGQAIVKQVMVQLVPDDVFIHSFLNTFSLNCLLIYLGNCSKSFSVFPV
jgi:hypothetical protein